MSMTLPSSGNVQVPTTPQTGNRSADDVEKKIRELAEDFRGLPEYERRSAEDESRAARITRQINDLDTELTAILAHERVEQQHLAATAGVGLQRRKTGAERLFDAPAVRQWLDQRLGGDFTVKLENCSINDFYDVRAAVEWGGSGPPGFDSQGAGALLPVGQPIPPVPRQAKLYLRDLIPVMTTTLATIPYVRELNPTASETGASGAQTVAEAGTKPSTAMSFAAAQAPVTVVAATLTFSKQLFEDAPLVVQYINQRLPYIIKYKEDAEFLSGSGTWPDITGIINTANVLSLTSSIVSGQLAQTVGAGYAQIENQDGQPTAVVLNPATAWKMFTLRAASGAGTFDAGTPFSSLPLTIWGVPSYRTRVFAAGSILIADFERGAAVIDREQVNVQTFRERYAELNEILLVCEERVGLACFRPDLFTYTSTFA